MKKGLLILLSITLALGLLAGCGSRTAGSNEVKREFVYVPNELDVDIGGDVIRCAVEKDNILYALCENRQMEEGIEPKAPILRIINLNDGTVKKLQFEIDNQYDLNQMIMDKDGNLVFAIINSNLSYSESMNEDSLMDQEPTLEFWVVSSQDGTVIKKQDITKDISDKNGIYVQYLCSDKEGNIYISGGSDNVYLYDPSFKLLGKVPVNSWISDMVTSKEGDVYITAWGDEGMEMKKIDPSKLSLGAALEGVSGYGMDDYFTGADQSLLVSSNTSLYSFDLKTLEKKELFQWFEVNVDNSILPCLGTTEDGDIWIASMNMSDGGENDSSSVYFLKKTKASEVKQKATIYFGTMWLGDTVKKNIMDFNKNNTDCQILVKEYGAEDYEAGMTQLNADITSGNCPDIIDVSNINYSNYINKGLLEDLKPYMDKSGIKSEDYLGNILDCFNDDGKIYGIMPSFLIETYIAKKTNVDGATGWTLEEMLDFAKQQKPENLFQYGTGMTLIYSCVYYNMDEFIDWNTGECHFDSENFINILKLAATFPKEDSNMMEDQIVDKIKENKMLLMSSSISSVHDYQMMKALFGEEITCIGFPNQTRKGNIIQSSGGSLSISSKSKNKDEAWKFIEYTISEEAQQEIATNDFHSGFPIKLTALDAFMEKEMAPIPDNRRYSYGMYDFSYEITEATQKDVDEVRDILNNAETMNSSMSTEISKIIDEESGACLSGQKSAEETAKVIQNRIQTYVNETR